MRASRRRARDCARRCCGSAPVRIGEPSPAGQSNAAAGAVLTLRCRADREPSRGFLPCHTNPWDCPSPDAGTLKGVIAGQTPSGRIRVPFVTRLLCAANHVETVVQHTCISWCSMARPAKFPSRRWRWSFDGTRFAIAGHRRVTLCSQRGVEQLGSSLGS